MGVQIGESAPDFTLPSDDGSQVTLSAFRGQKVILYFYPKAGTSGCTKQALGFRDALDTLQDHNAIVIGVSPDPLKALRNFRAKQALNFILLSDETHAVAEAYGVWGEKKMYGKAYMGIVRSHFVIDENGVIVDAQLEVSPDKSVELATAVCSLS